MLETLYLRMRVFLSRRFTRVMGNKLDLIPGYPGLAAGGAASGQRCHSGPDRNNGLNPSMVSAR